MQAQLLEAERQRLGVKTANMPPYEEMRHALALTGEGGSNLVARVKAAARQQETARRRWKKAGHVMMAAGRFRRGFGGQLGAAGWSSESSLEIPGPPGDLRAVSPRSPEHERK